jgi:cytoskeletal protein CcmA (bactofilin family)
MATNPRIPSKPSVLGIPSRGPDAMGAGPGAPDAGESPARVVGDTGRKLIVGRGIGLSGEISACDHLVVEGRIEAKLKDCRRIDIADSGVFKGSADIQEADIAGRFEGDLSVRGRLELRGTGTVSGTVRYGELMVEGGGRIMGSIEPLESSVTPMTASSGGD